MHIEYDDGRRGGDEQEATGVEVPYDALSPKALTGLIEEYVTRDGTDYGATERSLEDKMDAVRAQLRRGEIVVLFDPTTETTNIVTKDELRRQRR